MVNVDLLKSIINNIEIELMSNEKVDINVILTLQK